MSDQLSLFDDARRRRRAGGARGRRGARAPGAPRAAALAPARLPDGRLFGTSSWTFPGWAGLVYPAGLSAAALGREGLRHYARHPLLRTVGVDRSYYAPIPLDDLRAYADQLPDGFRCCLKAPAAVTSRLVPSFGGRARRGRGRIPTSCRSTGSSTDLLAPLAVGLRRAHRADRARVPARAARPAAGAGRASPRRSTASSRRCPREFDYAVEIRDRALLTPAYAAVLARHGVAHTYNYWSAMPMPLAQAARRARPKTPPFAVVRLLLKPGTWYEDQRDRFQPFNRLVEPDEAMRDEVVALTARALAKGRKVYVLVNNKAEGSSPLTVEALAERLAAVWRRRPDRRYWKTSNIRLNLMTRLRSVRSGRRGSKS